MNLEKQIQAFLKEKKGLDISSDDIKQILDRNEMKNRCTYFFSSFIFLVAIPNLSQDSI